MSTETPCNRWARVVADDVKSLLDSLPQEWIDPRDYGAVAGYSADQAGHVLRRAHEYGTLERKKEGRRFVYRPTPDLMAALKASLRPGGGNHG